MSEKKNIITVWRNFYVVMRQNGIKLACIGDTRLKFYFREITKIVSSCVDPQFVRLFRENNKKNHQIVIC